MESECHLLIIELEIQFPYTSEKVLIKNAKFYKQ